MINDYCSVLYLIKNKLIVHRLINQILILEMFHSRN